MRNNFESNEISVSPEPDNREERKFNDLPESTRRTWAKRLFQSLNERGFTFKKILFNFKDDVEESVNTVQDQKLSPNGSSEPIFPKKQKQSRKNVSRTPIFSHTSKPTIFAKRDESVVDTVKTDVVAPEPLRINTTVETPSPYNSKINYEEVKQERIIEAVREIEASPTFEQKFKTLESYLAKPSHSSRSRIGTINGELALAVESKPIAIGSEIVEEIYGQVSFAIKTTESNRKKITELEEELADLKAAGVPESFERKQKQGKKQVSVQEDNEDYSSRRTRINELRNEMNRVAHDVQVYIAEIGGRAHEDLIQGTTHFEEAVQDDLAERERRKQMAIQAIEDSFKPKQVPVRLAA